MPEKMNNDPTDAFTEESVLKRLADLYDCTSLAHVLRVLQPTGIFLTAVGLVVAAWALMLSLHEIAESRKVRQATLWVMLTERLDIARAGDAGKSATYESDEQKDEWKCTVGSRQLRVEAGQIQVLERMNSLGMSLRDIKAHDVNLVVRRSRKQRSPGILLPNAELIDADLSNSNLRQADLSGANLLDVDLNNSCLRRAKIPGADLTEADAIRADFRGADLSDAVLVGARLRYARFWGTDLSGADLTNADITGAHLRGADGLEQPQLDQACANPKKQQPSVPRKLVWHIRECP